MAVRWFTRPENRPLELNRPPRLASWNKAEHPDQVRLRAYLDDTELLLANSRIDGPWALRLDVGLPDTRDLLDAADLDNYAYPLAYRLKHPQLVSVWCTKEHGERSLVRIEAAKEIELPSTHVLVAKTTASASTISFKEQIHAAVVEEAELPHGPVSLELSFVVGPGRNWLNLWKPTIDSLDPLLGRTYSDRAWHPRDGRITELGMHLTIDPAARNQVLVGIKAAPGRMRVSPYGRFDLNDKVLIDQPGHPDHRRVATLVGLGPGGSAFLEIGQQTFGGPDISKLTVVDKRIPEGVVITELVGHAGPCRDTEGRCDVILARGYLSPGDHEMRSFRCDRSIDPPVTYEPELQEADPNDDTQVILRVAARANGWQVLAASNNKDIYMLPGEPDKRIQVLWSAGGTVLFADGGAGSWIARMDGYPDHSAKTQRILSALMSRTDVIPPHPGPAAGHSAKLDVAQPPVGGLFNQDSLAESQIDVPGSGAVVFRDDDAGYLGWLATHPNGYVINIRRDHNAAGARAHHAGCRTISGQNPHKGPWTGSYVKVCAKQLADLEQWAADSVRDPILPCGICNPGSVL